MHTIEIINELMCVMDEDGNGLDGAVLTGYCAAKQQIQTWTKKYAIDVAEAYRKLADHFAGC